MIKVTFDEIRDDIIDNFRRKSLMPIIGSGFTCGCDSRNGKVPSGSDYKKYMISQIANHENLSESEKWDLIGSSFSDVSSIYSSIISKDKKIRYLIDNFSEVLLENEKKDFLSLPWQYIYTLNIDDGIEKNSEYNYIIYANRIVNEKIYDKQKCIIKLHGDVHEMITYNDSKSEIFTKEQYVDSLKRNTSLLNRLRHDSEFNNLLFIGCSLNDELDLLSCFSYPDTTDRITSKFYCTLDSLKRFDEIKLERYGITHIVTFDSYDDMYRELYDACCEASKIMPDDLEKHEKYLEKILPFSYDENKGYLLYGKSLIAGLQTINKPSFFISRVITSNIIKNIDNYTIQVIIGSGYSGKSYILADIASKIRNRRVYLFESKERISSKAFDTLLTKNDCIILADSNLFTSNQIGYILENYDKIRTQKIRIIIAVQKNDRDFQGLLKHSEICKYINIDDIKQVEICNRLNKKETEEINPLLVKTQLGVFDDEITILDNIITISNKLNEKNKFYNFNPLTNTTRQVAALLSLATERRIYSKRATELDICRELEEQRKNTMPLIDCENTWSFEQSASDTSPVKYVLNAEYWLCEKLCSFAKNKKNHRIIIDAYKYIVTKIIEQEGTPNIDYSNKGATYRQYILFDNINKIFFSSKLNNGNGLYLIRCIYESLSELLSTDPNYMHQRAKCYIKSSYYEDDVLEKEIYLEKAWRDANVAEQVFEKRYKESANDKIQISIAHIVYTKCLILCHKCYIHKYENIENNTNAMLVTNQAFMSPYNTYNFAKNDTFNFNNVVEKLIKKAVENKDLINQEATYALEHMIEVFITNRN